MVASDMKLAQYLSVKNKLISGDEDVTFLGEDNEWLILYSREKLKPSTQSLFFGHRHLPMKVPVGENAEYVNLGDWITYFTYGVLMDNFEIKSINYSLFMIFNIFCRSNFLKVGDKLLSKNSN
jgi:UDP-2,3-diacylglucosamine hydrolase